MNIYINEKSICDLSDEGEFDEGLRRMFEIANFCKIYHNDVSIFRSSTIHNVNPILNTHIGTILKKNKSLNQIFLHNIQKYKKWEACKIHKSNLSYQHKGEEYVDTSVAEATDAEDAVLVNIDDCIFKSPIICVNKSDNSSVDVESVFDFATLDRLLSVKYITCKKYDYNSQYTPRDYQTILFDAKIFSATKFRNDGRIVYERIGHNEYWCVDNAHKTNAHLEVFSSTTLKHKGTSSIEEINIDSAKAVVGRTIKKNN